MHVFNTSTLFQGLYLGSMNIRGGRANVGNESRIRTHALWLFSFNCLCNIESEGYWEENKGIIGQKHN